MMWWNVLHHPFDSHRNLLRRALSRLTQAHFEATTQEDALEALTTWMHWLVLVDDVLAAQLGRDQYEAAREVSPASQAVLGVKHAWNLTKHHSHRLESVVRISRGRRAYPRVYPSLYREIVWLPFEELPLPPRKHRHPDQEQAYRDYLAERPVRVLAVSMTDHLCELAVQVPESKEDG